MRRIIRDGMGDERGAETVALGVRQQGCRRPCSQRHRQLAVSRSQALVVAGGDVGRQRHAEAFEDEIEVFEGEQLVGDLQRGT